MSDGQGEVAASHRSLVADMRLALLSEIGAHSIYGHLSRKARDPALASALGLLHDEESEILERLRGVMRELGGKPRRTSHRRRALAWGLATASPVIGLRLVLRVCENAEQTVARWYEEYGAFLLRLGETELARAAHELAERKRSHARTLGAWVENDPRNR